MTRVLMEDTNIFPPNVSVYRLSAEGETAVGVYLLIIGNYSVFLAKVIYSHTVDNIE